MPCREKSKRQDQTLRPLSRNGWLQLESGQHLVMELRRKSKSNSEHSRSSHMKTHSPLVFLAFALAGCASVPGRSTDVDRGAHSFTLSICELVSQGLEEGRTARIAATFRTDGLTYSYLISRGCGKDGVLELQDKERTSQRSVISFLDAGDRRCIEKGAGALCVLEANIDADIQIVRNRDGRLAAKTLDVNKFEYVNPR